MAYGSKGNLKLGKCSMSKLPMTFEIAYVSDDCGLADWANACLNRRHTARLAFKTISKDIRIKRMNIYSKRGL